jgi:hypothetical protein
VCCKGENSWLPPEVTCWSPFALVIYSLDWGKGWT